MMFDIVCQKEVMKLLCYLYNVDGLFDHPPEQTYSQK